MVRTKELDGPSLKALAHPLRVQILFTLETQGQASVTSLARELGESTGATSYHLRQLAKHGLVEQAEPDSANGEKADRQKWWRVAVDELHVTGFDFLADSATSAAASFLLREVVAERSRRQLHWYSSANTWPKVWQDASSGREAHLRLDPKQTRALADELAQVVEKYRDLEPGHNSSRVEVFFEVFPSRREVTS